MAGNPWDNAPIVAPASGGFALGAPSPEYQKGAATLPFAVPTAQAQLDQTGASAASSRASAARTMAEIPYVGAQAAADVASKEAGAREQTVKAGIAEATAEAAKREAVAKANAAQATNLGGGALDSIVGQLNDVAAKFAAGPGSTHGIAGLGDYLPGVFSPSNAAFDKSAVNLATQATGAFRVPGSGVSSDKDDARIDASALVNRYSPDSSNVQLLGDLRRRIDATRAAHGLAPAQWNEFVPNPDAQAGQQGLPAAGAQGGGLTPSAAGGLPPGWTGPSAPGGAPTIATGATRLEDLPNVNALFESGLKGGLTNDQINATVKAVGGNPASAQQLDGLREYLKTHPNYSGFANAQREVPTTAFQRVAGSPVGAFAIGAADAGTGGNLDSLGSLVGADPAAIRQGIKASADASWKSNLAGSIVGGGLAAYGTGLGLGNLAGRATATAPRIAAALANPLTADAAYGAAYGAGSTDDNRILGGLGGLAAGAAGGMFGRKLGGAIGGRFRGAPAALNPGERATLNAVNSAGAPAAQSALTEAAGLGVPMSLGDVIPSLAGAAARRSPQAAQMAESVLNARSRGQIDRFGQAVARDLGPTANIPQLSEDLMKQAQERAGPLYQQAMAAPPIGTPAIQSELETPFARQALARAQTIAANNKSQAAALGFALDGDGNVVLNQANPDLHGAMATARSARDDLASQLSDLQTRAGASLTPSQFTRQIADVTGRLGTANDTLDQATQRLAQAPAAGVAATGPQYLPETLHNVKLGMDDILEQQRNPITGKLNLDELGRSQNGVLRRLLAGIDEVNPAYGEARGVYAGPASSRDALARGTEAFGLTPDELAMQVGRQSDEHLGQMQLGARSKLMETANDRRRAYNPFGLIDSPGMESRINTLHPNNPGNASLFRTRDLENQLARTTNDIMGNSKTAGRQIADEAFASGPIPALAADAGMMALGQVPTVTIARALSGQGLKDLAKVGIGKAAVKKADQVAPLVFDTDPTSALATLQRLGSADDLRRNYINGLKTRKVLGMFGSGLGAGLPAALQK